MKKIYLVTEGKRRENQLGYDPESKEYVYFHYGKEIWREKGDSSLLDYFNNIRAIGGCSDDEVLNCNPIYVKYSNDCHKFNMQELKARFGW